MRYTIVAVLVLLLAGMVAAITPPSSGDIEGVTAGTWTTGGGTSGSITINGDSTAIMAYLRARLFKLSQIDGTTVDTTDAGLLTVDTTSAKLTEMIEDRIGAMLTGNTETFITVSYDDGTSKINFVVGIVDSATGAARAETAKLADSTSGGAARAEVADSAKAIDTTLATLAEMVADRVGAMLTGNTETNITVTYDDADNTIDFVVSGGTGDIEGVTAGVAVSGGGTTGTVTINVDTASAAFDEAVSDRAGEMVTGNTQTDVVVTYQDADNTIDFAISPDSIHTKAVKADTVTELGSGGLNLKFGSSGLKIWQSDIERMRFYYDSLDGLNSAWLTNFVGARISQMFADSLQAIMARLDTLKGRDPDGNPTLGDTLDLNWWDVINVSQLFANAIYVDSIGTMPVDSIATEQEALTRDNAVRDDIRDTTNIVARAAINDSLRVYKYKKAQIIHHWKNPLEDNVWCYENIKLGANTATPIHALIVDTAGDISAARADTVDAVFEFDFPCTVDSLIFRGKVDNVANYFTERNLVGPDDSSPDNDSLYQSWTTDWDYVSYSTESILLANPITVLAGETYKVRFIFYHGQDNSSQHVLWVKLGYR